MHINRNISKLNLVKIYKYLAHNNRKREWKGIATYLRLDTNVPS